MRTKGFRFVTALLLALAAPPGAHATDIDGPDDCTRPARDFGDAPEGIDAYPGIPGRFPTCAFPSPPGTQSFPPGCVPISTPPGPTGQVAVANGVNGYWLGCPTVGPNMGLDTDFDGKVSLGGGGSVCNGMPTDCAETFWATYGQDECYGSTDAGIAAALTFNACSPNTFSYTTTNCGPARPVHLNVLVDWNQDGDWNDVVQCPTGCVYEWAIKNVVITLPPGCATLSSTILAGPNAGFGWMRIVLTDGPMADDFPWNGTNGVLVQGGEVEDYPVRIQAHTGCLIQYRDFGDAPEGATAYPSGVVGWFPTCLAPTGPPAPSVQAACPPLSVGLPVGYVEHTSVPGQDPFWLGCNTPPPFVDGEPNGKTTGLGAAANVCDPSLPVDCTELVFGGIPIGQDECVGDGVDAGVIGPFKFNACSPSLIEFNAYNCGQQPQQAYLNILVDWNEDGDWLDNFTCPNTPGCVYEWAVQNAPILLAPGCNLYSSPTFVAGPFGGYGWMRVSISSDPAPVDFPWNGTVSLPFSRFLHGETEDYAVEINAPQNGCNIDYRDYGDAPEGFAAYPSGVRGHFPSCNSPFIPGDLDALICAPISTPPGPTGRVLHIAQAADPMHFWFGCTAVPPGSIDGEPDAKTSPGGGVSFCDNATAVDCIEPAFGGGFGQDECFGDADAGLGTLLELNACTKDQFRYQLFNCSPQDITVYLNVLVDWNLDGDWNDVLQCPGPECTPEWVVKNEVVSLVPGCNLLSTPLFRVGPVPGRPWMRITASTEPVFDDFPWNGSDGMPLGFLRGGETEDYPIVVRPGLAGIGIPEVDGGLWLAAPEPNPSSHGVELSFSLTHRGPVSLAVYDLAGRKVADLVKGERSAGRHSVRWDHRDAAGRLAPLGMYLVRLEAEGKAMTQRAVRIR